MAIDQEQIKIDRALRPQSLDELVGNDDFKEKIKITIEAANQRNESVPSLLIYSQPGLGKSSIANAMAKDIGTNFVSINAPAIKSISDLIQLVTKVKFRGILFIDEIHALNKNLQESMLTLLEDDKISFKLANKQVLNMDIDPITVIGATTNLGKLSKPFIDRFDLHYQVKSYRPEELAIIIDANIIKLGLSVKNKENILNIAKRSRGTPRIANRLLRRIRDYSQVKNGNIIDESCIEAAVSLEGIDEEGFTASDHKYMHCIYDTFGGGPVGLESISASINENSVTVESFTEGYLIERGLVARTKQGRILTKEGIEKVLFLKKDKE